MDIPQNKTAERFVLGGILSDFHLDNTNMEAAFAQLSPSDFTSPFYAKTYAAMISLFQAGEFVDFVTLLDFMSKGLNILNKGELAANLSDIVEGFPFVTRLDHYIRILKEKTAQRQKMSLGHKLLTAPELSITDAQKELEGIARDAANVDVRSMASVMTAAVEEITSKKTSLPTGFPTIDGLIGGWKKSNFYLLAGRPGMGKTTMALQTALFNAHQHKRILFFSLEMDARELGQKMIAYEMGINPISLENADTKTLQQAGRCLGRLESLPLMIDDSPNHTISDIQNRLGALSQHGKLDLVAIDNIQIISIERGKSWAKSRAEEVSEISRSIKKMAKTFDVPIIAISHLNRKIEESERERDPKLSDLKDSGSLEQDADNVIFLHRPNLYKATGQETDSAHIIAAKMRMAKNGKAEIPFNRKLSRFNYE